MSLTTRKLSRGAIQARRIMARMPPRQALQAMTPQGTPADLHPVEAMELEVAQPVQETAVPGSRPLKINRRCRNLRRVLPRLKLHGILPPRHRDISFPGLRKNSFLLSRESRITLLLGGHGELRRLLRKHMLDLRDPTVRISNQISLLTRVCQST